MEALNHLNTSRVWKHFEDICRIPRPSKSEEQIIRFVLDFAKRNNLDHRSDGVGNILISKPASPGKEHLKTLILQSHLDMVGEKSPDSAHDFSRDPIKPIIEPDWIRADQTTLGADCGIGIATQMAILEDPELEHGPLECLFTVDEESGMTGAKMLKPGFMKGSIFLNLDSEDWPELFIGCAGGIDTVGTFHFNMENSPVDSTAFRVSVEGLKGGHSGDEIHKSPGNSIKIINRFLSRIHDNIGIRLFKFDGGNMRNAIPREANAEFIIPASKSSDLQAYFVKFRDSILQELEEYEPDLALDLEKISVPELVVDKTGLENLISAITCVPHGVINWSPTLEGLVETSTNLASVKFPEPMMAIVTTSQRSSSETQKKIISERVADCFKNSDAEAEHSDGYPGWNPNPDSEILRITLEAYTELFNDSPVVRAIHAGLECGLILENYPDLDMLSIGPTIHGAHTPKEKINIQSTEEFWKLLLEVLKRIPEETASV